jgi:TM2 domain-containing membrane protein YozV
VVSLFLLLLAQTPVDFADHLYSAGDFGRAALEYERIAFLSLKDSALASYALLRSGEALLKTNAPKRAANLYSFGIDNLPWDRTRFTYGLLRACFAQDQFDQVVKLAPSLEGTDFEYPSTVYRSFSLAFSGDTVSAIRYFSLLDGDGLVDSTLAIINSPFKHRSLLFSASLSTILPGAGQVYCGRWGDAWQSFSVTAVFAGAAVYYFFFSSDTSTGNTVKGVVTASLGGLFWLANIYGAANAALDYNEYQERKRTEQLRNLLDQFDLEPEINRP